MDWALGELSSHPSCRICFTLTTLLKVGGQFQFMVLPQVQHIRKLTKLARLDLDFFIDISNQGMLQFQLFQIPFVGADTCGFSAYLNPPCFPKSSLSDTFLFSN